MAAYNSAQPQFGHFGRLIISVSFYLRRKVIDSGHQSQTAAARKTLGTSLNQHPAKPSHLIIHTFDIPLLNQHETVNCIAARIWHKPGSYKTHK